MTDVPADRPVSRSTLRVRYAETDAMGVVYHTNYIIWFEVGRGELSRAMGMDYRAWEAGGMFLPVVEVSCRYRSSARYGNLVTVSTWVEQARSRTITFGYAVHLDEDGRLLATGHTTHVCVDRSGSPVQIPAAWRRQMVGSP